MTKHFLVVYAKSSGSNFSGMSRMSRDASPRGDTLETMRATMRDALAFQLRGLAEDGDTLPEPHTTSLALTDEDFEGVEYFVVEHLALPVPESAGAAHRLCRLKGFCAK